MSATVLAAARPPPPGTARIRERLGLLAQSVALALQVAWWTVVGWVGAAVALLPVALAGAPVGRTAGRRPPRLRALPAATAEEAVGR